MVHHKKAISISILLHTTLIAIALYIFFYEPKAKKVSQPSKMKSLNLAYFTKEVPKVQNKSMQKEIKHKESKVIPKIIKKKVFIKKQPVQAKELVKEEVVKQKNITPLQQTKKEPLKKSYLDKNLALIMKILKENFHYPKRAKRLNITGEVLVSFTLLKNGNIASLKIKKGSKKILNRSALKTIHSLSHKLPLPENSITISLPIVYSLR
ncbi:MAG: TonB family protein [Helicobacteraceae bacterium]|nr:TonB family protein [Helicobacteraceae bacterium]